LEKEFNGLMNKKESKTINSVGRYSSGDEELDYDSAIQMLKKNYMDRINVLDSLFMQI